MKKYFFIVLVAVMAAACGNGKKAESGVARDMYDWMGSYSNDTVTFVFKDKGVCDVILQKLHCMVAIILGMSMETVFA